MMIKKIVLVLIICTVWNSPITKWDPKGKKSPKAWARASRRYDPTNDDILSILLSKYKLKSILSLNSNCFNHLTSFTIIISFNI